MLVYCRRGDGMKIAFVLLHYNNDFVTKTAIEYLDKLNLYGNDLYITIVDNCSPNGSGKQLKQLYKNRNNVNVILNDENGGFTFGNNIGYSYAKTEINADLIIVMNTDVYIKDMDFIKKVLHYEKEAHVIAPDIITKSGSHQNPFRMHEISNFDLKRIFIYNYFLNIVYKIPFLNKILAGFLELKQSKEKGQTKVEKTLYNIVPHGSCIIYTKKWIELENIAFVSGPFMYMEEEFLMGYLQKKKYTSIYVPEINVYHIEDASADASNKNAMLKRKFISKNMMESANLLIKMRNNGDLFCDEEKNGD